MSFIYRSQTEFTQARRILSTDEQAGVVLADYFGEFQVFISSVGSDSVNFQMRVPAGVQDTGAKRPATDWVTVKSFDEPDVVDVRLASNFEYRLQSDGTGNEAYLDVQWDAIGG